MLPREFLDLGLELVIRGDPASTRTAVSRFYHSVHLEAMRLARSQGFEARALADDHGALVRHFKRRRGFSWVEVPLANLRSARNHSDYHTENADGKCAYCSVQVWSFHPRR
jgi:hypothetical protein